MNNTNEKQKSDIIQLDFERGIYYIERHDYEPIMTAIDKYGPNIKDENTGNSFFIEAIYEISEFNNETIPIIKKFINHPDFKYINDARSSTGTTVIIVMINLITYDIYVKKKEPRNILVDLVKYLLTKGADPYIKNKKFESAYDIVKSLIKEADDNPELHIPTGVLRTLITMFEEWDENEYGIPSKVRNNINRNINRKRNNTPEISSNIDNSNSVLTENLEGPSLGNTNLGKINTSLFRNTTRQINSSNLPLNRNLEEGPLSNNSESVKEVEENSANNNISSVSSGLPEVNMSRINGGRRKSIRRRRQRNQKKRKATRRHR